jgi:hypothetical protein
MEYDDDDDDYICILYLYCSELVRNFFMLSTMHDNNENKNLLASGRTLNLLNNSVQEAFLLMPAIILMILFWM